MTLFPQAMQSHGTQARSLFTQAIVRSKTFWPASSSYIQSTIGYSSEYMVPLMAWMLRDGRNWSVVDIGSAFCTFPFMAHLAGFKAVAVNPTWGPQADGLPFEMKLLNALDADGNKAASLPGGSEAMYVCTEMVEHNDQNLLPGMKALFRSRPEWCFFTTPLAGTQGTPERVGWMNMPPWDGVSEGSDKELSGWSLDDLDVFVKQLGFLVPVCRGIDTCVSPVPGARLVVMGCRGY